jgi:hypothetical protein
MGGKLELSMDDVNSIHLEGAGHGQEGRLIGLTNILYISSHDLLCEIITQDFISKLDRSIP